MVHAKIRSLSEYFFVTNVYHHTTDHPTAPFLLHMVSRNEPVYIESNRAIQVLQYVGPELGANTFTAPSATIIPSIARYAPDFFFTTPFMGGQFTHYISVVIEVS